MAAVRLTHGVLLYRSAGRITPRLTHWRAHRWPALRWVRGVVIPLPNNVRNTESAVNGYGEAASDESVDIDMQCPVCSQVLQAVGGAFGGPWLVSHASGHPILLRQRLRAQC